MMELNANAGWLRPLIADRLTPYLEIDAARLQRNLQLMQQKADAAGVTLRPYIKIHKSVWIAFIRGGERDLLWRIRWSIPIR